MNIYYVTFSEEKFETFVVKAKTFDEAYQKTLKRMTLKIFEYLNEGDITGINLKCEIDY